MTRLNPFSHDNMSDRFEILFYLYENEVTVSVDKRGRMSPQEAIDITDAVKIYSDIDIEKDIDNVLDELDELGFIERDESHTPLPTLTQEGYQFAHQLKTEQQRRRTNLMLLFLTAVSAATAIVTVLTSIPIDLIYSILQSIGL